jgi:hypothetical protein
MIAFLFTDYALGAGGSYFVAIDCVEMAVIKLS